MRFASLTVMVLVLFNVLFERVSVDVASILSVLRLVKLVFMVAREVEPLSCAPKEVIVAMLGSGI